MSLFSIEEMGGLVPSTWSPPAEFPSLKGRKAIAVDVETRDPDLKAKGPGCRRDPSSNYIVGIAVGFDDFRAYYPIRHEGGGNLDATKVLAWARSEFGAFEGEVVGANLYYDLDWLGVDGIEFPRAAGFHDTQIAEPLLDEHKRAYNLNALSLQYLGVGKDETRLREVCALYGWKTDDAVKSNIWRLPAWEVGAYAEADVDRPLRIVPKQRRLLANEGLSSLYDDVERRLIPILVAMRRRGVRVDVPYVEKLSKAYGDRLAELVKEVKRLAGPAAEINAAESLAPALERAGLIVPRTAKKGAPSITDDWLVAHAREPLCDAISKARKLDKLKGTFIDSYFFENLVGDRIHATFNQLRNDESGAAPGRLSSEDPNLQNIPSRTEDGRAIRRAFIPEEGEEWEKADQAQAEYRYLANFAIGKGSEEARAAYRDDPTTDFHALCAKMVNRPDMIRAKIKNVNFCAVYGGGPERLAEQIGCSAEEAKAFRDAYDARLPFVRETYNGVMNEASRNGFILTILGRKQRFPFWEGSAWTPRGDREAPTRDRGLAEKKWGSIKRAWTYTALNKKLQGSNADHTKKAMVEIERAGILRILGPFLLTVHDEFGNSVAKTKEADEAAREAKRITETCIPALKIPFLVSTKRGPNWGETE